MDNVVVPTLTRWALHSALRVVLLHEVDTLMVEAIKQGDPQRVKEIVAEIAGGLDNLSGLAAATMLIGEMSLDQSRTLLFKIVGLMVQGDSGKPLDFWLMWWVHTKERKAMEDAGTVSLAPTLMELKKASLNFKRF